MAQKRMFSLKIIDTDLFIEMPQSTRLLYYELCMRADDDGFVASPNKIRKITGCSEDDYKILMAKQYIIPFESGICVIKHWRIHNLIRVDRYSETEYKQEKSMLADNNGKYELGTQNVIPIGNQRCTQVRVGKVREDKISIDIDKETTFEQFWNCYPKKISKKDAIKAWNKIQLVDVLFEKIMVGLTNAIKSVDWVKDGGKYIPHPATWLNGERWNDIVEEAQTDLFTGKQPYKKESHMDMINSLLEECK